MNSTDIPFDQKVQKTVQFLQEAQAAVSASVTQSGEFREKFLAAPQAELEKLMAMPAGTLDGINIKVLSLSPGEMGLVLPPSRSDSLTDEELSLVNAAGDGDIAGFLVQSAVAIIGAAAGAFFGWLFGKKE